MSRTQSNRLSFKQITRFICNEIGRNCSDAIAFVGKAVFDPKPDELTHAYDYAAEEQLKDFDVEDAKPGIARGALS